MEVERELPDGSGTSVQEVNQLIKQFSQMGKMMKMMQGGELKNDANDERSSRCLE